MTSDSLQQAIQLIRSGHKNEARDLLIALLRESPQQIPAWMWLVETLPNDEQRLQALEECLRHNPDARPVQQAVQILRSRQAPTPPPAAPPQPQSPLPPAAPPQPPLPPTVDEQAAPPPRKSRFWLGVLLSVLLLCLLAVISLPFQESIRRLAARPSAAPTTGPSRTPPAAWPTQAQTAAVTATPFPTAIPTLAPLPAGLPERLGKGSVRAVQYTTDGKVLAVLTGTGLYLYDAQTRLELRAVEAPAALEAFVLPAQGDLLAASRVMIDGVQRVNIWRAGKTAFELLHTLDLPGYQVECLAFSPDGTLLATGGSSEIESSIRLWDVRSGELARPLDGGNQWGTTRLTFSRDGSLLAAAGSQGSIGIWQVQTGQALQTLTGHKIRSTAYRINGLIFSPDGTQLASSAEDKLIRLWDLKTGKALRTFSGHTAGVGEVAFLLDGKKLVSVNSQEIRFWRPTRSDTVELWREPSASLLAAAPDGSQLAVANQDEVQIWQVESHTLLGSLTGFLSPVHSVAYSPDGQLLAAGGEGHIYLWQLAPLKLMYTLPADGNVITLRFSPDSSLLAAGVVEPSGRSNGSTLLWRIDKKQLVFVLKRSGKITQAVLDLAFSPDGRLLAAATRRGTELWRTHDGALIQIFPVREQQDHVHVRFTPDGKTMVIASEQTVEQFKVPGGEPITSGSGGSQALEIIPREGGGWQAVSADFEHVYWGSHTVTLQNPENSGGFDSLAIASRLPLLAAGGSRCVQIWNAQTGARLACLPGHGQIVSSVAFSPDGSLLVSGSPEGALRLWSLQGLIPGGAP